MRKTKTQVKKQHYFDKSYIGLDRFASYQYQLETCLDLKPKNILEIGIGPGIMAGFLRKQGKKITTCDFDKSLKPDVVADIRKLPFKNKSFNLVMAFQVLEHLPFKESLKALREMKRVSSRYVFISVPYTSLVFYGYSKLIPFLRAFGFVIRFPIFLFKKHDKNVGTGEHYWEIGKKGYSLNFIKKQIKKQGFKIKKTGCPKLNPAHYFFVLEK
jgi:ubiquinone/menaquinone biosynthesis C-methylase UbiE